MADKECFVMGDIGHRSNTGDMMVGRGRILTNKQPIEYIRSRVVEAIYGGQYSPISSAAANSERRIVDFKRSVSTNH